MTRGAGHGSESGGMTKLSTSDSPTRLDWANAQIESVKYQMTETKPTRTSRPRGVVGGLAVALLLALIVAQPAPLSAGEDAGEASETSGILGFTPREIAFGAAAGSTVVGLGYGAYLLMTGAAPIFGIGAGMVGTLIAADIIYHAAGAGALLWLWPEDEPADGAQPTDGGEAATLD